MTAQRTCQTKRLAVFFAATAGCVVLSVSVHAGEDLQFFDDEKLNFDDKSSPWPEAREASAARRAPPPEDTPAAAPGAVLAISPTTAGSPRAVRPQKIFPTPPPAPYPAPKGLPTPGQARRAYQAALDDALHAQARRTPEPVMASDDEVQVIRVRELSSAEREAMRPSLQCLDPIAGEIAPGARLRALIAQALNMQSDHLPANLSWVVGRTGECFDRRSSPIKAVLERVDAAVRQAEVRSK